MLAKANGHASLCPLAASGRKNIMGALVKILDRSSIIFWIYSARNIGESLLNSVTEIMMSTRIHQGNLINDHDCIC